MKNFLLIIIFAGLCVAYYFDKYYKPSEGSQDDDSSLFFSGTNKKQTYKNKIQNTEVVDVPTAEITKKAEELFPTKLDERKAWIAEQERAFGFIVNTTKQLPNDIAKAIRKDALDKYGLFFSKQLDYVKRQTLACKNCIVALQKTPLNEEQISNLLAQLEKDFAHDYDIQLKAIDKIVYAYDSIAEKSINVNPEAIAKISAKIMPIIMTEPEKAAIIFQEQALAYHNYSTKKIPEVYGNLKAGIEQLYPDDYIAQLQELNLRLDNALTKRTFVGWETEKKQVQSYSVISNEYFSKYIYNFELSGNNYPSFFVNINNTKALFFPADALEFVKGKFTLDIGNDETVSSNKIYITKQANFGLIVPDRENPCDVLDIMSDDETKDKEFEVEIVGLDLDLSPIIAHTTVKNGKILDEGVFKDLKKRNASGSLVIDKESKKVIGFLEKIPDNAYSFYARFQEPDIDSVLNNKARLRFWDGLDKLITFAKNTSTKSNQTRYRIVNIKDLRNATPFYAGKYQKEKSNIEKLCLANYALLSFMTVGQYAQDLETELVSKISDKYNNVFVKGPRMQKTTLASTFGRYTRDIKTSIESTVAFSRSDDFYEDYYYSLSQLAKNQSALNKKLNEVMNNELVTLDYYDIIHTDILAQISDNTFVPFEAAPTRTSTGASGVSGGGMTIQMRN